MVGTVVLVIFSIDVINHHDQEKLREERGYFSLWLSGHTQTLTEVRAGRNSIRNLEAGMRGEAMEKGCLLLFSQWLSQPAVYTTQNLLPMDGTALSELTFPYYQ